MFSLWGEPEEEEEEEDELQQLTILRMYPAMSSYLSTLSASLARCTSLCTVSSPPPPPMSSPDPPADDDIALF